MTVADPRNHTFMPHRPGAMMGADEVEADALEQPLQSGLDDAHYDPECAAVYIPSRPMLQKEAKRRGRHSIEAQHENIHWLQQVATSFGEFQLQLKTRRLKATIHYLLGLEDLPERLVSRNDVGGRPLFDLAAYQAVRSELTRPQSLRRNPELVWGEMFFLAYYSEIAWFALSFAKTGFDLRQVMFTQLTQLDEELMASLLAKGGSVLDLFLSGLPDLRFAGLPINSRDLMESGAVVLELLLPPLRRRDAYDPAVRLRSLAETSYTRAIRMAAERWRLDHADMLGLASPFLTCVDVAFAPPVPPRDTVAGLAWADIYPPLRFQRCVEAVLALGLERSGDDISVWVSTGLGLSPEVGVE